MLVSSSKDGSVLLHAIETARVPLRHMRTGCVRFSASGDLAFLNQPVRRSQLDEVLFLGNSEALISERPDVSLRIEGETERADMFKYLATNYKLYGVKSALYVCSYNERVALDIGCSEHASVWRFLGALYCAAPKSATEVELRDLGELRRRAIVRIAEYAAEHDSIQLCAVIMISLDPFQRDSLYPTSSAQDSCKWFEPYLPRKRLEQYLASYIEILQSFRLEVEAAEIRKFGRVENLGALTQKDTSFRLRCITCNKAPSSCTCTSLCSICTLPANRSVSVWCTVCGHGGHMEHMANWFRDNDKCPVEGCQHECAL